MHAKVDDIMHWGGVREHLTVQLSLQGLGQLTCGGGEEDAKHGEEAFPCGVVWQAVAPQKLLRVPDETML